MSGYLKIGCIRDGLCPTGSGVQFGHGCKGRPILQFFGLDDLVPYGLHLGISWAATSPLCKI